MSGLRIGEGDDMSVELFQDYLTCNIGTPDDELQVKERNEVLKENNGRMSIQWNDLSNNSLFSICEYCSFLVALIYIILR